MVAVWGDVTSVLYVLAALVPWSVYAVYAIGLPDTRGPTAHWWRHWVRGHPSRVSGTRQGSSEHKHRRRKLYQRRNSVCQHAFDRTVGPLGRREGDNELFISSHLVMLAALYPYSTRQREGEHYLQPQQLWTPSGHGCRTCFRKQGCVVVGVHRPRWPWATPLHLVYPS